MLINFTLENWRSFRKPASFSMIASREKQHGERLARIDRYKLRLLPVAAIYGGNASGKTNFFAALNFARNLIVRGTRPDELIPVETFRLDGKLGQKVTRFNFELLVDDSIYEYGFAVNQERVVEERLVDVRPTTEKELFIRNLDEIRFAPALDKDQFLRFAFKGTRENQLFLTNAVQQKVETFKPVYDWFKDNLVLIAPDTRFEPFEQFLQENSPLYDTMNKCLGLLDTGIAQLGGEDVDFDNLPLPEEIRSKLQSSLKEGMTLRVMSPLHERYVFTRKDGEVVAKKLVTYHKNRSGDLVKFEMGQESDGSKRVIDLLPAFLEMSSLKSTQVYVIDEVDRSLHTLLTRQLLQGYLEACSPENRSQFLLTTHDVLLMDQDLLRRDEMWVAERDAEGGTSLLSFSEYKDVRNDKDIRKSYLQGRLGGVPRLLISGALANDDLESSEQEAAVGEA